jgi:hypothetical protein
MPGRDPSRSFDPDDWFGELARQAQPQAGGTTDVETWIGPDEGAHPAAGLDEEAAGAERARDGFTIKLGTLLALAAGIVVVVLVAGLALGGVFSGNGKQPARGETTAAGVTTPRTPSTTSTTAARPAHPASAPSTTLKPGDHGAQVKLLQRALTRLGYDAGTIDGDYGSSTEAALTRFQKASRLTADGVLGPASLRALELALTKSR